MTPHTPRPPIAASNNSGSVVLEHRCSTPSPVTTVISTTFDAIAPNRWLLGPTPPPTPSTPPTDRSSRFVSGRGRRPSGSVASNELSECCTCCTGHGHVLDVDVADGVHTGQVEDHRVVRNGLPSSGVSGSAHGDAGARRCSGGNGLGDVLRRHCVEHPSRGTPIDAAEVLRRRRQRLVGSVNLGGHEGPSSSIVRKTDRAPLPSAAHSVGILACRFRQELTREPTIKPGTARRSTEVTCAK